MEKLPQVEPFFSEELKNAKIGDYLSGETVFKYEDVIRIEKFFLDIESFETDTPSEKLEKLLSIEKEIFYIATCLEMEQRVNQFGATISFPESQKGEHQLLLFLKKTLLKLDEALDKIEKENASFLIGIQIEYIKKNILEIKSFYDHLSEYDTQTQDSIHFFTNIVKEKIFDTGEQKYRIEKGAVEIFNPTNETWEPFLASKGSEWIQTVGFNEKTFSTLLLAETYLTKKYSLPFDETSLPVKFALYTYLLDVDKKTFDTFIDAARKVKNKKDFLHTFLALYHKETDISEKIFSVIEHVPEDVVEILFAHYGSLTKATEDVVEFVCANYKTARSDNYDSVQDIQHTLLSKSATFLDDIAILVQKGIRLSKEDIVKKIDSYQKEILLFASTFKTLSQENKTLSLEDVVGTRIQKLNIEDVTRYQEDIVAINKDNRRAFMSDAELAKRTERLLETLSQSDTQFYGTTFEGKLISFVSFQEQSDGSLLAESLNVAPSIKQSHIGNAFFETLVKDLGRERDIYGYVHKKNADKLSFYEKLGFVTTPIVKDDGSEWYMIRYHAEAESSKRAA